MSTIDQSNSTESADVDFDPNFPIDGANPYHQPDTQITQLHIHSYFEIGYCFEGSGIFVVENKIFPFKAGDISIINSKEMHLAKSSKGTTSLWRFLSLKPDVLLQGVDLPESFYGSNLCGPQFANILHGVDHPTIEKLLLNILQEIDEQKDFYKVSIVGLLFPLFAELQRFNSSMKSDNTEIDPISFKQVMPALDYLAANFDKNFEIDELANISHLSPSHFRRLFKKATNLSPQEYLIQLRVKMAASMLKNTDKKVTTISQEVGFASISSLNRNFKRIMKLTPKDWKSN
ncbi:MAG: hypothetical protein COA79_18775 [Planctomycetota bacterium]|nr:MAG: hypothetical protein COA79_18775 [Planctomycetota bacterium]